MVKVALTGGIGAGKSTVAALLAKQGAEVVSGDELGRMVLDEDDSVREALLEQLGAEILNSDGTLNRKSIAALVFSDTRLTEWLTSLTFTGIYSRWKQSLQRSRAAVVVFDAALIFEWNVQCDFDLVVAVVSDTENAYARAAGRFTLEDFERRIAAQLPADYKIANADFVINNDGSLDDLARQVIELWNKKILPLIA